MKGIKNVNRQYFLEIHIISYQDNNLLHKVSQVAFKNLMINHCQGVKNIRFLQEGSSKIFHYKYLLVYMK